MADSVSKKKGKIAAQADGPMPGFNPSGMYRNVDPVQATEELNAADPDTDALNANIEPWKGPDGTGMPVEPGIEEPINDEQSKIVANEAANILMPGSKALSKIGLIKKLMRTGAGNAIRSAIDKKDEEIGAGGTQISKPATMTQPSKPPVNPNAPAPGEFGSGRLTPKQADKSLYDKYEAARKAKLSGG